MKLKLPSSEVAKTWRPHLIHMQILCTLRRRNWDTQIQKSKALPKSRPLIKATEKTDYEKNRIEEWDSETIINARLSLWPWYYVEMSKIKQLGGILRFPLWISHCYFKHIFSLSSLKLISFTTTNKSLIGMRKVYWHAKWWVAIIPIVRW